MLMPLVMVLVSLGVMPQGWAGGDEEEYLIQHNGRKHFWFPSDARVVGMGGAYVSLAGDPSAVYGNPAALGTIEQLHLRVSYFWDEISGDLPSALPFRVGIEEDLHGPSGVMVVPNPWFEGALGLGFNNYWSDVDDPGDTTSHGQTWLAAYGLPLGEQLFLGYGLGYFQQEQDRRTNAAFGQVGGSQEGRLYSHRLGLLYQVVDPVTLGLLLTYGHGNSSRSLEGGPSAHGEHEQLSARLGGSWRVLERTLIASDLELTSVDMDSHAYVPNPIDVGEEGDAVGWHLGVEQGITEWLSLRAGYRFQVDDYNFNSAPAMDDRITYQALSCGAGVLFDKFNIDYGLEYRDIGDGDWLHVISTGVKF